MKKLLLLAAPVLLSIPAASFAQIVVRLAPPPVVVEHPGRRPHPGWVWIGGHHRWNGSRYVWAPGYWAAPPRPHAVWVAGHWRHARGGYVWVDGHWR